MPKFRLMGGSMDFTEPAEGGHPTSPSHGRRFFNGDVLYSRHDIRQTFVNKFVLVDDSTPLSKGQPIPNMHAVEAELARIEAATPLRPTVTTPPPTKPVAQTETAQSGAKALEAAPEPDDAPDAPEGPTGKDVTKQFPKALEEDYKVFKQGKTFGVYNADDMAQIASGIDRSAVDDAILADLAKRAKA